MIIKFMKLKGGATMRYLVPPDMSEKEKIVGGLLTINQLFWIVLFGLMGMGMFFATVNLLGAIFSGILALPFFAVGVLFALYKKENLTLFRYLYLKRSHKKKQKEIFHYRKEVHRKW